MLDEYMCSICLEPRKMVLYICSQCKNSLEPVVKNILKTHGMKRLLEVVVEQLGDTNYEIKLKEDISRALVNYNERYKEESEEQ